MTRLFGNLHYGGVRFDPFFTLAAIKSEVLGMRFMRLFLACLKSITNHKKTDRT